MEIEFDPAKRDKTLKERGLDFARCDEVFTACRTEDEAAANAGERSIFP
jgi:uncharacterized DUF497 family protein